MKVRSKQKPIPEDPDNIIDPDDLHASHLIAALEEFGPMALGELRRKFQIQPTVVGRLVKRFPEVFCSYVQSGKPLVKLLVDSAEATLSIAKPEFTPIEQEILDVLKGAKNGVTLQRLYSRHGVASSQSKAFAEAHP